MQVKTEVSSKNKVMMTAITLGILILMIGVTSISAQKQNITTVMGLNAQNINNTLDSQRLLLDRAMLHKANNTDILMNENHLLGCVQTYLLHGADKSYKIYLGNCDGNIINHLTLVNATPYSTEHGYGNNQTMIKLAYAYLKARGIQ
jgi:hypothetical protein